MTAVMWRTRSRAWWTSTLPGAGVLLITGLILAEAVISSAAGFFANSDGASQFTWAQGAGYVAAQTLGLVTSVFSGGTYTSGPSVFTTVSGISFVNVVMTDVTVFQLNSQLAGSAVVKGVSPSPGSHTVTNVTCAYAIITTYSPNDTGAALMGEPIGCMAFAPQVLGYGPEHTPDIGQGCQSANGVAIDLLTGNIVDAWVAATTTAVVPVAGDFDSIGGMCALTSSSITGTPTLYVSYAVYLTGATPPTPLAAISVTVSIA